MRYQLLVMDLDNTLLTGPVGVSAGNREALARAEAAGCRVVVCTGRGRFTTRPVVDELDPVSGPHILFNGGATFPSLAEAPDEVLLLPREAVERCLSLAAPLGLGVSGFEDPRVGDLVYLAWPTDALQQWAEMNRGRTTWVDEAGEMAMRDLVALLFWGDERVIERLQSALGEPVGLSSPRLGTNSFLGTSLIELSATGGTKGEALARLARRLDVPRSAIIAVGDARPDISMIEFAGLGVAVGNAAPDVKAAADYVAPRADQDAIAHVVERFVLA